VHNQLVEVHDVLVRSAKEGLLASPGACRGPNCIAAERPPRPAYVLGLPADGGQLIPAAGTSRMSGHGHSHVDDHDHPPLLCRASWRKTGVLGAIGATYQGPSPLICAVMVEIFQRASNTA
jgi:hypothetical protein